ncbi:MAG TPA: RAMP superfamily protein [Cyanobacteria bacterium UBA11149]|nr:RAMP superfamily protein [Cyanobacteria bacterium UBA11367]HBE58555.1 RAMP superfamily protein [Cyanobacteria bacterium UBA11366]HBK64774.1 RAMP superfamily protein [Cyanobacteria bacterium UBA11166]HBR76509.1 RAMP superfamily protein [Cyanobacteria bacterium UBA11159]HBS67879.1 RAMP superfamily protein [Cyanobacteria bacterium UBA11153]HBW90082.1 RAMP superfamily protein [Cyanobacteria bacterium UBA11149]HCA93730.1 RAMP superfamily protein [Cyanobacteria bacterium UBA9226]
MIIYKLRMKLLSDTTFGRGDGVAGLVDQEVEHDSSGFPYLRGRTLKGLLSEECDNLIAVLSCDHIRKHWKSVACHLFGKPGSTLETISQMQVGDACLPEDLRQAVAYQIKRQDNKLMRVDILQSLTAIRRQTAIDSKTGVADETSLRSARVVLRELEFTANLSFEVQPDRDTLTLLSVGTLALRRVGSNRNRGLGHIQCQLFDPDNKNITSDFVQYFGTV